MEPRVHRDMLVPLRHTRDWCGVSGCPGRRGREWNRDACQVPVTSAPAPPAPPGCHDRRGGSAKARWHRRRPGRYQK